jgi:hypothetical protein
MIQGRADGSSPPVLHRRTWKAHSGSAGAVKRAPSGVGEAQGAAPTLTAPERTLRRSPRQIARVRRLSEIRYAGGAG